MMKNLEEEMELYVEIITKIKTAVLVDDVDSYKVLCALVNFVNKSLNYEMVKQYQQNFYTRLGNINLICLSCKSATVKVLQHLLSDESSICSLPYLTMKCHLLHDEKDEECHTAIYYAIRSNKTEVTEILIERWLNDYFKENSNELHDVLSKAFKDLMVRNVYVSEDMRTFIKSKLVDLQFFNETSQKKHTSKLGDTKNLKDLTILRIDFVLKNISDLIKRFWYKEPQANFLLLSKYIAKNIQILESSMTFTDRLPWKEINFCLIIFIRSCQSCFRQYPLYHFVLNKHKLLKHLKKFSKVLKKLKAEINSAKINKYGKLLIGKIDGIENIVNFKKLYDDYTQIRDLYSLEKIKSCVDLAISANIVEKCDQLVIVRALQIIGEYMKDTKDSHNLSEDTYKLLNSSLPDNMKKIVNKLRDSLSHEESLSIRSKIEMSDQHFFKGMQSDISEMNLVITDIIRRKKVKIIGRLLHKMRKFKDIHTMKMFFKHNHVFVTSLQKELVEAQSLNLGSIGQLENLVLELEREVKNQINSAVKLFLRIQDIVRIACGERPSNERSVGCFKSYIPVDPRELLKIYSDFCSVTSVSLQTKIESTNQTTELKTIFNMPKNMEKYREILIKIHNKFGLISVLHFFQKINDFLDYSDIPQCISELQHRIEAIPINGKEMKQFERMIVNLIKDCHAKAIRAEEMFQKINALIQSEKDNSKLTQKRFRDYLRKLITMIQFDNEECSCALEMPMLNFQEEIETLILPSFPKKFSSVFQHITTELVRDNFARGINFLTALGKINMFLELRLGKIKWIKEFKQMLDSHKMSKSFKTGPKFNNQMEDLLPSKFALLAKIINDYHTSKVLFQKSPRSQIKLKLLSMIEMVTLDSMTILGSLPNRLTHSAFFLDSDYPIVNSINLRNHLAHGNSLVDIVLGYDSTDLLLNADKMLTLSDLLKTDLQLGKKVENDPWRLKVSLDEDSKAVKEQLQLFDSLTEGKMAGVKDCLSKGADMLGKDLYSQTCLHFAAKGSCLKIVKFVLAFHPDVSAVDVNFQTALHVASFNGSLPVVEFLIQELNASVYKRDVNGRTPLHLASINGHTDIVKCLLKHRVEITCKDIFGNAALHYAVIRCHFEVVNILLKQEMNAGVNKTFFGVSALHLASEAGHESLVTTLLHKIDVNFKSSSHLVPLHYAARGGHADVVQLLINRKADKNARNLHGNTPLHLAAEKGHDAVVSILLQYRADINASNSNGLTALSFAAKGGFTTTSKLLLQRGIVMNGIENFVWTPLDLAAKIGNYLLGKLKLLLGKAVTVGRIENSLCCPIILAAKFGHHELVKLLLDKCDTSSKISALHWAALKGHLSIVELLVNNGINVECEGSGCTALHLATCEGRTEVVNFLISKGYVKKVNSKICREELEENLGQKEQECWRTAILFTSDNPNFDDVLQFSGTTALHLSAFRKHEDIVRILLKFQADIYIKDDLGTTPLEAIILNGMAYILVEERISINFSDSSVSRFLQLGAAHGHLSFVEFVKYCVQTGSNKDADNRFYIRIFRLLFKSNVLTLDAKNKALAVAVCFGHEEIVNYLTDIGANVNAESPDGFTPLDLAVEAKRKNIVSILIDDKKADISSEKERKYLLSAIKSGHEDLVDYFLTRNPANGTSRRDCNGFPLHTAVQYGHLNIVKKLLELEKREDINEENETAATPLQLASGQGYCEITRLLLSNDADPNKPDHFRPLLLAVTNEDYEMIEILIKAKADVTLRDKEGYSPIESAVKNKSLAIMEKLFELSTIDVNLKSREGYTLLHHAAVSGSLEIVKRLVEKEAAINNRDKTGAKPIHLAAREGHQDIVEYFLSEGLDINDRGENGWSLLHYAAAGNRCGMCESLLRISLDVNNVDDDGSTPLHVAARMGSTEVLHILLHCGAYYDQLNLRNETPLNVAMASIFEQNPTFPVVASLTFITSLFSAVQKHDISKVEASLNEGLKLTEFGYANIKNAKNISLIQYAAEEGSEDIVDLLLKYCAVPNEVPLNGGTSPYCADTYLNPRILNSEVLTGTIFGAECNSKISSVNFASDRDIIELSNHLKLKLSEFQNGANLISDDSNTLGSSETRTTVMKVENSLCRILTDLPNSNDFLEAKSLKFLSQPDVNIHYLRACKLYEKGQFEESLKHYKIILQKRIAIFGEIDPGVLDIQEIVCEILINQGKYEEAENLTKRLFNIRKEILGDGNKDTLRAMRLMASVLGCKGRKKEALKMLEGILRKQKVVLGANHAETLRTQIDIIELMCEEETECASLKEALNMCLETVKKLNKFPVLTRFILQLKVKVAQQLFTLGSYNEALDIFKEVFEIQKEMSGLYSQTSDTLFQIARTLFDMGKEEDSLKFFKETLEIRRQMLGPENEKTLNSRFWVANALYSQRMFHEALEFYQADLEARTVILGENHPNILDTQEKIDFILSHVIS